MPEDSSKENWDKMTAAEKIRTVRVAIAMSKNIHSDTIIDETIIGCQPDIEAELSILTELTFYTTSKTTFGDLLEQLQLL